MLISARVFHPKRIVAEEALFLFNAHQMHSPFIKCNPQMQSEMIRGIYFFNQSAVLYYARERYYRHVQTSVLEVLKKYGSDPVLLFWKAYGIIMEGIADLKEIIL